VLSNRIRGTVVVLMVAFLASLGGCSLFGDSHPTVPLHSNLPPSLTPGVTDASPAPNGWYRVLNGQSFAAQQGAQPGLTGSRSRPGMLAGCPVPVGSATGASPVLVLSGDGGHTWQSKHISGAAPLPSCSALTDAQQPNIYVVGPGSLGSGFPPTVYATNDAGTSWHALTAPNGYIISIFTAATTLVGGHLFTVLQPSSGSTWRFAELTLPDGAWQMLDTHLPYHVTAGAPPNTYTPPMAFSVDPDDPSHLYAAMSTGAQGVSLFATRDSGATWKQVYAWPTSTKAAVWTASGNRVYAQDQVDTNTANQFFYSSDGGTTWSGSSLHERGADQIFVGPNGRVITFYSGRLFSLDPATGIFTALGAAPSLRVGAICATTSDPQATLLCGDQYDTYARLLPASS
jgi:hypothetical protein